MEVDYCKLGERIKQARKDKKMTQETLSEILDVNPSYVSKIETAAKHPSLSLLLEISAALNVSLDVLLRDSKDLPEYNQYPEIVHLLDQCDEDDILMIEGLIKTVISIKKRKK